MSDIETLLLVGQGFAYVGGIFFFILGIWLSFKRGRFHPLLLVSISALSFSWIEAPYDWAVYAQFPPQLQRMPEWWPMNMTWGGLPAAVPPGYIAYFILPGVISAALAPWVNRKIAGRLPITLLVVGFVVGFLWAFAFNAGFGARLGVFHYGYVIEGLAFWPGTKHQYPWYDAVAMGVQMMVFTYVLGRTDAIGRTFIEVWADSVTRSKVRSTFLSVAGFIVLGHVVYLSVFAPHLATKVMGLVTVGPTEQLFEGVPNQPL